MGTDINSILLRLVKRAERQDESHLVATFVDTGTLVPLLTHTEHQIIFGRRGTGKTHALFYIANIAKTHGDIAIKVDMTNLGSTGGIYSDPSLPLKERATRLLMDTLSVVHDELYSFIVNNDNIFDLSIVGPLLDAFVESISDVRVEGDVEEETTEAKKQSRSSTGAIQLEIPFNKLGFDSSYTTASEQNKESRYKRSGVERHRVHFGIISTALRNLCRYFAPRKVWILLDEWSEVPVDLQPFLADLLRRTIFPIQSCVVKIAAIEQRSMFRIAMPDVGYIGFQLGADIEANINLDEYMVFDNNSDRAKDFFAKLFFRHIKSLCEALNVAPVIKSETDFIRNTFTQQNTFDELVKAAEGVPRDAINIIGLAAQKAESEKISVEHIRLAAKTWFNRAKENSISTKPQAMELLHWLIDEVIGNRRARAFLLRSDIRDNLIDFLFDERVLHIVKDSVSAHDQPGIRFKVYSIDYGCYVELINTSKAPKGLFEIDNELQPEFVSVPITDYRSIRRAILDIGEFYRSIDSAAKEMA